MIAKSRRIAVARRSELQMAGYCHTVILVIVVMKTKWFLASGRKESEKARRFGSWDNKL